MYKFVVVRKENLIIGYVFENEKLADIRCYEENSLLGNVYIGRVSNILKNINAAFVDINSDLSCYLAMEDYKSDKKLKIGDLIPVQISKDSIKTKQPSVTTDICLNGKYVVIHTDKTVGVSAKIKDNQVREHLKSLFDEALLDFLSQKKCANNEYGAIIRTAAGQDGISDEVIKEEMSALLLRLDEIMYKSGFLTAFSVVYKNDEAYIRDMLAFAEKEDYEVITDDNDIYKEFRDKYDRNIELYNDAMISLSNFYGLSSLTQKALNKKVFLKSGAYLVIEPTEAMTVIDVNSGKAIKGNNSEEYIYKINCEAAAEIARQLRIRNLSGIIIIDFISMKNSELNQRLINELKELVLKDTIPVQVVDITKLGLVELTRKKVRKPLHEMAHLIKN